MEENIEHKAPGMEMGEQDASVVENKEGQEALEGQTIKNIVAIDGYTENINRTLDELSRNPNLEQFITPEVKGKTESFIRRFKVLKTAIVTVMMAVSFNASASTNTIEGDTMKVKTQQDSIPEAPEKKKEKTETEEDRIRKQKRNDKFFDLVIKFGEVLINGQRRNNDGIFTEEQIY